MKLHATRTTAIERTARVIQLEGAFDLPGDKVSTRRWDLDVPLEDRPWNVGLIVGPSGAGKSTCARELFGENATRSYAWDPKRAVVDGFPEGMGIREVTALLSSVGFSSPPAWLRPFGALSTGEQFRCNLARALASQDDPIVVDEFTSVVDRTVAQIGSCAVARAVRERKRKFVAVACHYDILDWLQPDWVLEPASGRFEWRSLRRRPEIELEFYEVTRPTAEEVWRIFRHHHYLSDQLKQQGRYWVCVWKGQMVAFHAALPFPHGQMHNAWRSHRVVCLPDFQGVGIGNVATAWVAAYLRSQGKRFFITTSHQALTHSLAKQKRWRTVRQPSIVKGAKGPNANANVTFGFQEKKRLTASFEYVGPPLTKDWTPR